MNIFKLLKFRKILFCLLKACFMMLFNILFLIILVDEFINISLLANIFWFRFIYFSLFYSILFYLFCFYLRKELDNLEKISKIKNFKKKEKFLEKFKKNYKELNRKEDIKKRILVREKSYCDFKAPNFNKQIKLIKSNFLVNTDKSKETKCKEKNKIEKTTEKNIISQKNKKKISIVKLISKIFLILFFTIMYLGAIILYPGTYLFLLFILFFYSLSGIIGKILIISFVILVLAIPYILFFGDEDMKKDFYDIWIDKE